MGRVRESVLRSTRCRDAAGVRQVEVQTRRPSCHDKDVPKSSAPRDATPPGSTQGWGVTVPAVHATSQPLASHGLCPQSKNTNCLTGEGGGEGQWNRGRSGTQTRTTWSKLFFLEEIKNNKRYAHQDHRLKVITI